MKPRTISTRSPSRAAQVGICAVIVVLIWIVFGQTLGHDFVNYDDKTYVYENSLVSSGLSLPNLGRAFVDVQTSNWHPLTIISHMIDCQIFDLKAGGHHFTNVLLHTIAALLLFVWLQRVSARIWTSAFVAALFAIHPLRVESVAWIAERKDVLSALFFFLTLLAYARYARERTLGRYLTMSIFFACGLMAKPMLVTTPAVLLLLDYWPLKRFTDLKSVRRMIVEKIPLFVLSAGSSIIALALQVRGSRSVDQLPFMWRLENALVSCVTYVWQIFWPTNLAVFYPHPDDRLPLWQVALAALFLIAVTVTVFKLRQTRPYLLVGWLWYLIMLSPVMGIIEVGLQGHADRYTYLPHVGLYIAFTWLIDSLATQLANPRGLSRLRRSAPAGSVVDLHWFRRKEILVVCASVVIVVLSFYAWKQTTYWKNGETLWTRTLEVTKDNDVALTNFGDLMMERRQVADALAYYERALAIRSSSQHRHYNLSLSIIHDSVGAALARTGRLDEALPHLREAVELRPDYPHAHYNLGAALFQKGDLDGAIAELQTTLSIHPDDAGAHTTLGNALVQKGRLPEAADHYQKALQSDPDAILPLNNLAWIMSAGPDDLLRNDEVAVNLAEKANQLSVPSNPVFVRTLAAAYAQAGQFEKAIETARRAAEQANDQGARDLAAEIARDVDLYQRRLPLRDPHLRNAQ